MKYIIASLICLVSFSAFHPLFQRNDVLNLLKSGKIADVSQYFDDMIDISVSANDEVKSMTKNQATNTFKMFLADNKITSFDLSSQRESKNTMMYIAGKLKGNQRTFDLTVLLKISNNKVTITSLRAN